MPDMRPTLRPQTLLQGDASALPFQEHKHLSVKFKLSQQRFVHQTAGRHQYEAVAARALTRCHDGDFEAACDSLAKTE
ncbi:Hypothetical predicted protein [Scomber scombrus]|uniref:Uncharacterized protein n=1 Tax=Scomber scombrus TaxID=13677 RepID=A0AAV1Q1T1_SCOSC